VSAAVLFGVTALVLVLVLIGGWLFGLIGAAVGLVIGLLIAVVPWRGQRLWSWAQLYLRRKRAIALSEPMTVANDRAGGGVRYQNGVAAIAIQVLGKAYTPTVFTGSASTYAENVMDVADLQDLLHQNLNLSIDSMSIVIAGARRRGTGDYARVYDTMIGPPPYAGQRETWLIARISSYQNADALKWRPTAGTAAIAAAQRISAALRLRGIRARVATSTDIVELERRLGQIALEPGRQQWGSVRGDGGWMTTYAYRPSEFTAEVFAQAWSMPADGVIQNITLYPDRTATATITVRTAQPLPTPPSVVLHPLPGEQAAAISDNMCAPLRPLRGVKRGPAPTSLVLPIGPSGVLLGKVGDGDRLMLPLSDPGDFTRVHIAAEEHLSKRIVIRVAATGDRVTVHARNIHRWTSVRMPDVAVTERSRPAPGTTVSVIDGPLSPVPRPHTVITVGEPGQPHRGQADIVITQIGPALLEVAVGDRIFNVEMELFRAENRYVTTESMSMMSSAEFADERR